MGSSSASVSISLIVSVKVIVIVGVGGALRADMSTGEGVGVLITHCSIVCVRIGLYLNTGTCYSLSSCFRSRKIVNVGVCDDVFLLAVKV